MAKYEELPIPVFSSLEPVYGDGSQVEEAQLRFDNFKSKFVQVFGHAPHVFARSPGVCVYRCLVTEKVFRKYQNQNLERKKDSVWLLRNTAIIKNQLCFLNLIILLKMTLISLSPYTCLYVCIYICVCVSQ